MPDDENPLEGEEKPLCQKCGTLLEESEDELICPKCDLEIDYFGEQGSKGGKTQK